MKYTNIKQLIIKFVGGGIINFPTRFLRWIKINGDTDDGEGGGGGGGEIDKFYIKLNRENLHLDNMDYVGFDTTIGHNLDFFFEDTDINLVSKIMENIIEQVNNLPIHGKPNIYNDSLFEYISHETGLVGGYSVGTYPIFTIMYDNGNDEFIIKIKSTNYLGLSVSTFEYLNFVRKEDGKFYYQQYIYE